MPRVVLEIHLEKQEKSNYCYAAVIQAIQRYYGITKTQTNIVQTYYGEKECQNEMQDPFTYLEKHGYSKGSEKFNRTSLVWDIAKEIDAGFPVIVKIGISEAEGHFVLLVGYDGKNKTDKERKFIFKDPLADNPNNLIEVPMYSEHSPLGFPTNYDGKGFRYESFYGVIYTQRPAAAAPAPAAEGSAAATEGGRRKRRKTSKGKSLKGGFYPSVYSGITSASLLAFAAARQGYKLLKNKRRKTRKSSK